MVKVVIFDFDGVLIDSNAIKREAYYQIFASLDNSRGAISACLQEEREGDRYHVIRRILQRLCPQAGEEEVSSYAKNYGIICEARTSTCREIPGASACLDCLAGKYDLYINSATYEDSLRRVVYKRGWDHYFREVLGSPRTKVENLARIMKCQKVAGQEMVFIGDSQRDLNAAQTCGCHFVGIKNADNDFKAKNLVLLDDLYTLDKVILEYK
ncbi:MAG: HAD hydrolase-like protein [bacterium]|nr:HAD hydrolase-like protein [bacterium]